jgi:hypothetical protein
MCVSKNEFQYVNPTTQIALYSECIDNCLLISEIKWSVYYGLINESERFIQWIPFDKIPLNDDIWFFGNYTYFNNQSFVVIILGMNTTNLTISEKMFFENRQIVYWRFDVVSKTILSSLHFEINHPPKDGFCLITPDNGTTSTVFYLVCSNWTDVDGIKDYSFYGM